VDEDEDVCAVGGNAFTAIAQIELLTVARASPGIRCQLCALPTASAVAVAVAAATVLLLLMLLLSCCCCYFWHCCCRRKRQHDLRAIACFKFV